MEVLNSRTKILPVNKDLMASFGNCATLVPPRLQYGCTDKTRSESKCLNGKDSRCLLFWGDHLDQCRLPKYYFTKSTFVA